MQAEERMFGVRNPKLQALLCSCGGQGWLATLLYGETREQDKLVLLCVDCDHWMEVGDPDLNLLPESGADGERVEGGG